MFIPKFGAKTPIIDMSTSAVPRVAGDPVAPQIIEQRLKSLRNGFDGTENVVGAGIAGAPRSALRDVGGPPVLDPRVLDDTVLQMGGGRRLEDLMARLNRIPPTKPAPTPKEEVLTPAAPATRVTGTERARLVPGEMQQHVAEVMAERLRQHRAAHEATPREFNLLGGSLYFTFSRDGMSIKTRGLPAGVNLSYAQSEGDLLIQINPRERETLVPNEWASLIVQVKTSRGVQTIAFCQRSRAWSAQTDLRATEAASRSLPQSPAAVFKAPERSLDGRQFALGIFARCRVLEDNTHGAVSTDDAAWVVELDNQYKVECLKNGGGFNFRDNKGEVLLFVAATNTHDVRIVSGMNAMYFRPSERLEDWVAGRLFVFNDARRVSGLKQGVYLWDKRLNREVASSTALPVASASLVGRHVIKTSEGVEVVVKVLGHVPIKDGKGTDEWLCEILDDQGKGLGHMRFEGKNDPRERFLWHAQHALRQYKEGDRFAFLDKTKRHYVSVVLQKDLAAFLRAQDARLEVYAREGSVFERRGVKFRVVRFDPAYSHGRDEWELDINDGYATLIRDNMVGGTLVLKRRGEASGQIVKVGSDLRFPSQIPDSDAVYFTAMLDLLPFLSEDNQRWNPLSGSRGSVEDLLF